MPRWEREEHGLACDVQVNRFVRRLGKSEDAARFQINQVADAERTPREAEINDEVAVKHAFAKAPADIAGRDTLGVRPLRGKAPQ